MAEAILVLGLQRKALESARDILAGAPGVRVWSREAVSKIAASGFLSRSTLEKILVEDIEQFLREGNGPALVADPLLWRVLPHLPAGTFKILHLIEDGRLFVTEQMNWHRAGEGNVYREGLGENALNPNTVFRAAASGVGSDLDDDLRARPGETDLFAANWSAMGREQMIAWGWAHAHRRIRLPQAAARLTVRVEEAAGLDWSGIGRQLGLEIAADEPMEFLSLPPEVPQKPFPFWFDWTEGQRVAFEALAADEMHALGYFRSEHDRWKPSGYGEIWSRQDKGQAWYEWMYGSRKDCHAYFRTRFEEITAGEEVRSVLEYGCGRGLGYADFFADKKYLGIDISPSNIQASRTSWPGRGREFQCTDFTSLRTPEKFDFVFSSGTIDNVHDVREFLRSMVANSKRRIWLSYTRGWFPELQDNRYYYSAHDGCFYIDISATWLKTYLESLGCREVRVYRFLRGEGLATSSFETIVEARVPHG